MVPPRKRFVTPAKPCWFWRLQRYVQRLYARQKSALPPYRVPGTTATIQAGPDNVKQFFKKCRKNIIRSIFKIVGRNLPCHIHRYPAFKTKHHLIKRTVKIMYLMKMQTFFFLASLPYRTSIFSGTPDPLPFLSSAYRCTLSQGLMILKARLISKNQARSPSFFNTEICFGGRNLKRYGRNFQLIKLNNPDIFVQIEVIQLA